MLQEANALKRFDKAGISALEAAFIAGPLADAMEWAPEIPRRQRLSPDEFEREYRRPQRPVLINGIVDHWPAIKNWSFRQLAERCGDTVVTVDGYNSAKAREMTFGKFVALLEETNGLPESPVYLQEWYYKVAAPILADDLPELDIAQYDFRRDLYGANVSTNHQLWIGQQGGVTIMHQDSYMVDVMHVQIVGEKRWYVMSPAAQLHYRNDGELDLSGLLRDPKTELMRCTLKPGQVLYLPALWWHRVELLSDSIGLGRKCLDECNLQAHIRLRMAELLALALNADEVRKTHPELFNVVLKRAQTWAKRMDIDLSKLRP
jgi:hypothetical protein